MRAASKAEKKSLGVLAQDESILEEYRRLLSLYSDGDKKKLQLAEKLIVNAAFMAVNLDKLARILNENGFVSTYQNGKKQSGTKASAEAQQYNSMSKNYMNIIKQLDAMLPRKKGEAGDEFDDF